MNIPADTDNPFELSKASNFSDTEVLDYWVDIMEDKGGLMSILQPRSRTPLLLLGGKGSGKTHLMRYCSAPVQAARHQRSLAKALKQEGFVGVYVPVEAMNIEKFSKKGQNEPALADIFAMYFELWLATSLLETLSQHLSEEITNSNETKFVVGITSLFDIDVSGCATSVADLIIYLTGVRKNIDFVINNSNLTGSLGGLSISFSHGRLAFGIPRLMAENFPMFEEKSIVYLIDEAELLTVEQQKFLNTLIRSRNGNATIRVGSRLYGIRTYQTLGAGEPNKLDSEFQQVVLDGFMRDQRAEYTKLVTGLVTTRLRRLQRGPSEATDLSTYFERLDRDEQWQAAMKELVQSRDRAGKERPYFRKLRNFIEDGFSTNPTVSREVAAALRVDESPLLEKTNVFLLYKKWPKHLEALLPIALEIANDAADYARGGRGTAYAQILSHYRSDLIAQLYRDFGHRVPFAGVKTLVELSQGIPRNFLTILKYIYRRSFFANERPFNGGLISVASQSGGVRDSSTWFWEDAQPDSDGGEVREAVESLANLFRSVRFSDCPAECDVCTFSIEADALTSTSKRVIKLAENWSYLIQTRDGALNKNDRGLSSKYQLGPMLAPKWDLSQHRRGNIELSPELVNAIFDRQHRNDLTRLTNARTSRMKGPSFAASAQNDQEGLFR